MTEKIFCLIRKEWVALTPEEVVRQKFIHFLIDHRGFPIENIAVELPLKKIPHLTTTSRIPDRRADILCFAKGLHNLYPLLLVECKAVKITKKVLSQVIGYNTHVQAPFVSLVNEKELKTGWYDSEKGEYSFIDDTMLDYEEMLERSALMLS